MTTTYPIWNTPSNLGNVTSGSTATFIIEADNTDSITILNNAIPSASVSIADNIVTVTLHGPSVETTNTYTLGLRAYNASSGYITDRSFTLTIQLATINWTQNSLLHDWPIGVVASVPLQTSYFEPLDYSLVSGVLPRGIYLDSAAAVLYGIAGSNLQCLNSDKSTWTVSGLIDYTTARTYNFTIRASAKNNKAVYIERTFTLTVVTPQELTADTTLLTADSTTVDASASSYLPAVLLEQPSGVGYTLGTIQNDNQFVYHIHSWNPTGEELLFEILSIDTPFLVIEPHTGYITGQIPYIHTQQQLFDIVVLITKVPTSGPIPIGQIETFTLTVISDQGVSFVFANSGVISFKQGEISTAYITAYQVEKPTVPLYYELASGTLPPGITLSPTGLISGRVNWSATIGTYNFVVRVYNPSQRIDLTSPLNSATSQFQCAVSQNIVGTTVITKAYDLYYKAFLKYEQREYWRNVVTDSSIFRNDYIFRPEDPNFGRRIDCEFLAFTGLSTEDIQAYAQAMYHNWSNKRFRFGTIQTAVVRDKAKNYIADVVYVNIIDQLINSAGNGPPLEQQTKSNQLPTISNGYFGSTTGYGYVGSVVYPPTLPNQLQRLKDGPGQITDSLLPNWMLSIQASARTIGWVPAAILSYVTPGSGARIVELLGESGYNLTNLDFHIDRLILKDSDVSDTPTTFDIATTFDTAETTFEVAGSRDKYIYFNTDGAIYDISN